MQKKVKAVLLGLTNSGKSTVANILKSKGWPILEVDDQAQSKNNGIWSEDEDILDKLFNETNKEVLKMSSVVFVTSFLEPEEIKAFYNARFKIIELHASYEELVRRKVQRDGVPSDNYERFNRNYKNYQQIVKVANQFLALRLDTTKVASEELANRIELELLST